MNGRRDDGRREGDAQSRELLREPHRGSRSGERSPAPTGLLSFCVTQINGSDFQFPNSFPSDKCQSRYHWSQAGRQ